MGVSLNGLGCLSLRTAMGKGRARQRHQYNDLRSRDE